MKKYNKEILKNIERIESIFNEYIKIINEDTQEYDLIKNHISISFDDLECCYNSYSRYKERAYNNYLSSYRLLKQEGFKGLGFGINSYNIMQFTLCMYLEKDNYIYKIYITKCYNKIIVYKREV